MQHHVYCPRCAAPLELRPIGGRDRPACAGCDYIQFASVSLGVGGVVTHSDRVLLMRRRQNPGRGRWTIPGGYVEADEPWDDAVVREVAEETGLECRVVSLLGVRHRIDPPDVYAAFHLEWVGGAVDPERDPFEVAEMGWFDAADMAALPDLAPLSHELALLGLRQSGAFRRKILPGYTDTQRLFSAPGGLTDPIER